MVGNKIKRDNEHRMHIKLTLNKFYISSNKGQSKSVVLSNRF